jgi:hypothetical protein
MSRTVVSLSIEEYNLAERVLPVVVDVTFQERRTPTLSNQSINQSINQSFGLASYSLFFK